MAISVPLVLRLAGHVCIGPIDWLLGNGLGGCYVPRVCVCVCLCRTIAELRKSGFGSDPVAGFWCVVLGHVGVLG